MSRSRPHLEVQRELKRHADAEHARVSQRFFKTGPGEYGEGDQFIGVRVPVLRKLARKYKGLAVPHVVPLLESAVHEERQLALFILVLKFQQGDESERRTIYELYLDNTEHVNNWDLVDCSAHQIAGEHLLGRNKRALYKFAKSRSLWERRIAIMATFRFIKAGEFEDTLALAKLLLNDEEDLIHKAVGWMLRELGNRDRNTEEKFLAEHYDAMPRTMLRYAIEKFPAPKRKRYLQGRI